MSANSYGFTTFNPVSSGTVTLAVNTDAGSIAGTFIDTNQVTRSYIDVGGQVSVFALPGAAQTDITAVNGAIVAGYELASANGLANEVGFVDSAGTISTISRTGVDVAVTGVNAGGTVVGTLANGNAGSFSYANGVLTPIAVAGAQNTAAAAINAGGAVAGSTVDSAGVQHGFLISGGVASTIDPAGSLGTTVTGITAGGEVVGEYYDSSGSTFGFTALNGVTTVVQPFGSTFTLITGVNNAGTVVGSYLDATGTTRGFVDLGGVIDTFDPAGSINTQPMAINAANQVVGTYDTANGVQQGFAAAVTPSYTVSTIDPGVVGGVQGVALNNGGEIVGTYADAAGALHGFVDIAGGITTFNDTGAAGTTVTAVNDAGTFTGFSSLGAAANGQFFIVSGGAVTDQPGGPLGIQPVAINASGVVAGNQGTSGFTDTNGVVSAVRVTGAASTTVTGINAGGEVVGSFIDPAGVQHGFTVSGGVTATIDPAGSTGTAINGVNASGEVVGSTVQGSSTVGFTDVNGVITTVAAPGSTFTVLTAVNGAGTAVGFATVGGQTQAIVDAGGVVSVLAIAGAASAQATGINDAGEVVGTYADAAGVAHAFAANTTPACYCPGTMIRTERGEVAVERLAIGDRVATVDGAVEPVRWIGRRCYAARFLRGRPALLPVRVRAGALADGVPHRDLLVSPSHALLLDGMLVQAGDLVNGTTIVREAVGDVVEYVHIELARHGLVWANGAAAETFVDDHSRAMFSNAGEYAALYGDGPAQPAVFCAERLTDGYALELLRSRLGARAGMLAAA